MCAGKTSHLTHNLVVGSKVSREFKLPACKFVQVTFVRV